MSKRLSLGDYVKLKSGEVKQVVETIEEDEYFILFILDDLSICSFDDIDEVIGKKILDKV